MASYFSERFGVYDLNNFRVLDRFKICDGVSDDSLTIDPSQKWAAVMCDGIITESDDGDGIGPPPKGAGVAIVGLDGYR